MKKLLVILSFLFASLILSATNYYVRNGGNDAAAGTSDGTAWLTVSRVNSFSSSPGFAAGDSIFFKRGETISNSSLLGLIIVNSGTANNPIYIGAYGTGDDPILDATRIVFTGSNVEGNWTNTSGNIWTFSTTEIGTRQRIWLDDVEIKKCKTTAVTATERWRWASNVLYLYSVGNPATTYSTIKRVSTRTGIDLDNRSYIVISDLNLRNFANGVSLSGCNGITIQNGSIGYNCYYFGVIVEESATNPSDSISILNNILDTNDKLFDDTFDAQNTEDGVYVTNNTSYTTVANNTFINWGHTAFCVYDKDQAEPISYFKVYDNYFTWSGVDYGRAFGVDIEEGITGSVGNEIYNNYIYNQVISSQIQVPYIKVHHNIWNGTTGQDHSLETGGENYPSSAAVSIVSYNGIPHYMEFDNNVFANSEGNGVLIRSSAPPTIQYNKFRNNIFYNNKGEYWADQTTGYQYYQLYIQDSPTAVLDNTYQNNIFYYSGVTDLIYYGRDATNDYPHTVTEFNAENGNSSDVITDNIDGNPLFESPSDFRLRVGSPGIDLGIDVGLTEDKDGNVIPFNGIPDIGAYEYGSYIIVPGETGIGVSSTGTLLVDKNGRIIIIQ